MKRISILILALMCALVFSVSACFAETGRIAMEESALEEAVVAESPVLDDALELLGVPETWESIDIDSEGNQITPAYVAASSVRTIFSISGAKATCYAKVTSIEAGGITSVKGTIKVINSKGETVKTYKQNLNRAGNVFTFNKRFSLTKKGSYYMKATLACYQGSVKKETITKKTSLQVYQ